MEAAQFETRFLEFVFQTNSMITAGAVAHYVQCSIEEAQGHLERLAGNGTLTMDSDDTGNLYFEYPNRQKVATPQGMVHAPQQALQQHVRHSVPHDDSITSSAAMQVGGYQGAPSHNGPVPQTPVNPDGTRACYFCGEKILAVARKCKHCGELLDHTLQRRMVPVHVNVGIQQHAPQTTVAVAGQHSPGIAAILSLVWPGLGQMYCGRIGAGLGWMSGVFLGYLALLIPGLVLHIACVFSAANTARASLPPPAR